MNRQDLFDLVHVNTERKWEKLGNISAVFTDVLQDFCSRNRFWWRSMVIQLNTIQGQGSYDLTAPGAVSGADLSEIEIEEVVTLTAVDAAVVAAAAASGGGFGVGGFGLGGFGVGELTPGGGGVTAAAILGDLVPVYDEIAQIMMLANSTPVQPTRYFFGNNDTKTLIIDPPDRVYNLWMAFWAMPSPSNDSTNQVIPLVPSRFHRVLRSGMEAYIWQHVYGSANPRYVVAKKEYEDGIILAQSRPRFSTNYSQQFISSESAIRST